MKNQAESIGKETKTDKHEHKKGIVITARVHPGETVGSFMMKGFIDYITSSCR